VLGGVGSLQSATTLTLSHTLCVSVPPSSPHTYLFCNRAPRRALVHRAHVVLFTHQAAATSIIVVQLSLRRARLLIACAPTLNTAISTTRLHLVAGRPYRLLQYALSSLSQSAISLTTYSPTHPRGHNCDRFLCSSIVLLPILGHCLPHSFDPNGLIVHANKAGPTTSPML